MRVVGQIHVMKCRWRASSDDYQCISCDVNNDGIFAVRSYRSQVMVMLHFVRLGSLSLVNKTPLSCQLSRPSHVVKCNAVGRLIIQSLVSPLINHFSSLPSLLADQSLKC